jgi:acyl dehydratase
MTDVDWREGRITDDGIAFMRSRIGVAEPVPGWNRTVTAEGVEHFALGVGDDNPLWWDDAYARSSRLGGRVAPPCYLYSHAGGPRLTPEHGQSSTEQYLPGAMGLLTEERWSWRRLPRVGEVVRAESALVEAKAIESDFGGRSVLQMERIRFLAGDETIAHLDQSIRRFERGQTRSRAAHMRRKAPRWTEPDRDRFDRQYESEAGARRGAEPRYVEDVKVGDRVGPLLKGPLTITGMVGFLLGAGSGNTPTNRMMASYLRLHPGARLVHPKTGVADSLKAAHFDTLLANAGGLPDGYDFGVARVAWFAHLLSDWGGDEAFLQELQVQIRRPSFLGDITWLRGLVTEVHADHVVVDLQAENQHGELTTRGRGRVQLPSRAAPDRSGVK